MSNAKWKLGLPKSPGKYLFAKNLFDGGYQVIDAVISSKEDLLKLIDNNPVIVAYRNWPSINTETINRLIKLKYKNDKESLRALGLE